MAKIIVCIKRLNPHLLPNSLDREALGRFRQALALPVYTVALLLDYLSDALGWLAAWIAGEEWP